jgi:hypothetical protein
MNNRPPHSSLPGAGYALALASLLSVLHFSPPRAAAQPNVVGQWDTVQSWPVVAVHMNLLPTGKVLFWPYSDDPRLYDPATGTVTLAAKVGENPFCAVQTFLADGRMFMAGGHNRRNGIGIDSAYIYNPAANTWTQLANMNNNRWYPSGTTLPNGDVLVTSGSYNTSYANNTLPQVFQFSNNQWRSLTSATLAMTLYPRTFVAPDGRVFVATQTSRYLNTAGTGSWTTVGNQQVGGRENYGSAAMYDIGKVLFVGGGDPPTATAEIIDLNAPSPAWTLTGSMSGPRRQNNVTCLPDGTVLCTGGSASAGFNTEDGGKTAQLWNPATGTWTTMALEAEYRGYHSTALLLPDGRVISAGGDNHPTAQIFSPPYLFKGARPTISSAPATVAYGNDFTISTPDAASITKVTLTALGALTHAQDWNGRLVPLSFTSGGGSITATAPANGNIAPPGPYLLWIVNNNGVPSPGRFVTVAAPSVPCTPADVSVNSITVTTPGAGAGKKRGQAVVVIRDNCGNAIANATVSGSFTGSINESVSGSTDANGSVTLQTVGTANGNVNVTFCVNNVTNTSLPYNPANNIETCDSN